MPRLRSLRKFTSDVPSASQNMQCWQQPGLTIRKIFILSDFCILESMSTLTSQRGTCTSDAAPRLL